MNYKHSSQHKTFLTGKRLGSMNIHQREGTSNRRNKYNRSSTSHNGLCYQELVEQIRIRDNYTCQLCGRIVRGRSIVHHIYEDDERCFTKFILTCDRCNHNASTKKKREEYKNKCLEILKERGLINFKLEPLECCIFCKNYERAKQEMTEHAGDSLW